MLVNKSLLQHGAIGLVQGLWLYWASDAWSDNEALLPLLAGGIYFLLVAGTLLQIFRLPCRSAWVRSIALGALFGLLAAWVFSFSDSVPYLAGDSDRKFSLLVTGVFVFLLCLPLCRQLKEQRSYFATLWEGFYWIAIALVFTGLCWAFLSIWAGLFRMLEFDWFHEIFFSEAFAWIVSPIMLAMGFFLQIQRDSVSHSLQKITSHFFRILNPFICVLVIIFAAALVLQSLGILFEEVDISSDYVGLLLFLFIALNALIEDKNTVSENTLWLTKAALLLSPVILFVLINEQWQLISLEGLMPTSYWNMVLFCWLLVIALSYIGLQLRSWIKRSENFQGLNVINVKLAYVTLLFFALVHIPPFDALRMSALGQAMQVLEGEASRVSLSNFRCELGYYGDQSLRGLQVVVTEPEALAAIEHALSRKTCLGPNALIQFKRFKMIPEGMQIPKALKEHLTENYDYYLDDCSTRLKNQCVFARVELPGDVSGYVILSDASDEVASFHLVTPTGMNSFNYEMYHSGAEKVDREEFINLLEGGGFNWVKPKGYDLQIQGRRYSKER